MVGSSVWNLFGGFRNAQKGRGFLEARNRIKANAPTTAGSFAIWGLLFACFDCTIAHVRKKEDLWNPIISGAATGGLLAFRSGMKNMARNAVFGGAILAAIEGFSIGLTRYVLPLFEKQQLASQMPVDMLDPPVDPLQEYFKKMNTSSSSYPLIRDPQFTLEKADISSVNSPSTKSSWSLW